MVIGVSIGILYGLTHSVQIGAALIDAIDLYGDSSGVSFNTGSPAIASVVSIILAVIGGFGGFAVFCRCGGRFRFAAEVTFGRQRDIRRGRSDIRWRPRAPRKRF